MQRTEVHKFGGTSLASAERFASAASLVSEARSRTDVIVVASAMAGVTDELVSAAAAAARGDKDRGLELIHGIHARHLKTLSLLAETGEESTRADLDRISQELADLISGVVLLGQLTPRTLDRIIAAGEKLSVRLFAVALRGQGLSSSALDADTFLETDDDFGRANPLGGVADRTITAALRPLLEVGEVPVVTGFCGHAPDGATTTLGRGGSDLTATYIASAIGADEVTIWTDVDGVYSADPRVIPEARVIPQLNYREAAEISFYGAKMLHQRSMIPVTSRGIPVQVRNSLSPKSPGTVVDGRFTPGSHPVKAISAVRDHCLLSVEGKGMAGVPGVAARVFRSLADRDISVTMISQSSSESTICLAVPGEHAVNTEALLKSEFQPDMCRGDVEEIVVRQNVALVAVVGLGMANTPGVASRVFSSLSRQRINVLAIAQGSSELNISLAVDQRDVDDALRAVHTEFGLHRLDTGHDTARGLDLVLLGCGKIGRALAELILDRRAHLFDRFGLTPRIVAVADRSGYLFEPGGIPKEKLASILQTKESSRPLASLEGAVKADPAGMVKDALSYRLVRPVLVDVSDADDSHDLFLRALRLGCDVVTANKKPLAGPLEQFRSLMDEAGSLGRILKAEATVGAGLPVMDTLEMLLATGDRLSRFEGSLSGTLSYLMGQLEQGTPFSEAVARAVSLGYTEPDPVDDLTGVDVARKAMILGRLSGLVLSDDPVELTGLVEPSLAGMELPALVKELERYDEPFAVRISEAEKKGMALRYLAKVRPGAIEVGPVVVAAESPFHKLQGTDNMILFESERYSLRPLVVAGPGAGVEVTAMGVLGDILRIAAERR